MFKVFMLNSFILSITSNSLSAFFYWSHMPQQIELSLVFLLITNHNGLNVKGNHHTYTGRDKSAPRREGDGK